MDVVRAGYRSVTYQPGRTKLHFRWIFFATVKTNIYNLKFNLSTKILNLNIVNIKEVVGNALTV